MYFVWSLNALIVFMCGVFFTCSIETIFSSTNAAKIILFYLILCCYMHAGTGITLRHMRWNNTCGAYQELPPIDQNLQYDFNLQQFNILPYSVTVLPVSSGFFHQFD